MPYLTTRKKDKKRGENALINPEAGAITLSSFAEVAELVDAHG
jgi:hypothetical protein